MRALLLIVPGVIALCAWLYNSVEPSLFGIPFFYWFQLLLVPVSAVCIYFADTMRAR